jgi:geranylgeranyl pyrophosphate synthase
LASNQLTSVNFFEPVQDSILLVEQRMRSQADGYHPDLGVALQHLLDSGGKRVRPAVTLLMGAVLGASTERLVTLSAAIEMLHTATLVHDDLIDGSFMRRGSATLNARWSPAATVLTGDYIFSRAAKLAAETDSMPVMNLFAQTLSTIVNGEITQMFSRRQAATREAYEQRIYAKTASMFELAAGAAAMLSPVDEETIELARCYGISMGMAFQVVDDVLDFTGEQETVGKPVGSDLRQGLVTLPTIYYMEQAPDDPDLQQVLQGAYISDALTERLVASINASSAVHLAMQEARARVDDALEILVTFPDCTERQALEGLTRYIINRRL